MAESITFSKEEYAQAKEYAVRMREQGFRARLRPRGGKWQVVVREKGERGGLNDAKGATAVGKKSYYEELRGTGGYLGTGSLSEAVGEGAERGTYTPRVPAPPAYGEVRSLGTPTPPSFGEMRSLRDISRIRHERVMEPPAGPVTRAMLPTSEEREPSIPRQRGFDLSLLRKRAYLKRPYSGE